MAKKRKLEPKPAPLPESEPEPEPEPEPEEEEEEEEEDDPAEEEEEEEEDDPAEEEPEEEEVDEEEEEEEEDDPAEEEPEEEEDDDDGEEDSSDSNDEYPNGSTAVNNPNPNGPTPVDPTSVRDLLAPLFKDQLISLLSSAAVSHPSVRKEIQSTAEESSHRNIFVNDLSYDITSAVSLYSVFSKYGTIEDVQIVIDKNTGRSKGYAFVLFQTRAAAQNALKEPRKKIGSGMASCKLASFGLPAAVVSVVSAPSTAVQNALQPPRSSRKIYVGNVSPEINPGRFLEFFQQFGEVEEGPLGLDEATGKPKGFALFVYKTAEGANRALEQPHKSYGGHLLHCSRSGSGPIGKVQMAQQNNNFSGGAASPAVAPPAHHMAAQAAPMVGVGYNQPVGPQVLPVQTTNAALGRAVGQALTALGFGNLLGGIGGGVQAPAVANSVVPPVQGGYTARMPVQGGYAAGAPVQGGYAAGAPMQGGYAARAPMHGEYAAGAPVWGGYANQGMGQGGDGSRYPLGGFGGYGNHAPYR